MLVLLPVGVQVIVLFVAPADWAAAETVRLVSGVSLKVAVAGVPLPPQSALAETVTFWVSVAGLAYPSGAAVSCTEYVPNGRLATHTVPSAPVVAGLPGTGFPFESLIENTAPDRSAVAEPVQTPLVIGGVFAAVQFLSFPVLVISIAPSCRWLV